MSARDSVGHGEVRPYRLPEECVAKEPGIVERFAGRFGQAPAELSEGPAKPLTRKRVEQVRQRIGRLESRSRGFARHYDIALDTDPTGQHAAARIPRQLLPGLTMTHPGMHCLRTDRAGGHPFITVIAHQLVQAIHTRLPEAGHHASSSDLGRSATRHRHLPT